MGLDMFAFRTKQKPENPVDFELDKEFEESRTEIHYWRKHPDLHRWMERLYREKGGQSSDFNCVPVELNLEDLERLETEIKVTGLEQNHGGFFFGSSQRDDSQDTDDLEFIRDARRAIEEGDTVYYDSWW
jgi:hypothetical protein